MELIKRYQSQRGVDLNSSDLVRPNEFATRALNSEYTELGGFNKRPGYKAYAATAGGYGTWTYRRTNPTTGVDEAEIVSIDDNLHKLLTTTLSVSYAGSASSSTLSVYYDPTTAQFRCLILQDTTTVLDTGLNVGIDDVAPKDIDALAAEIDALADYTVSVTGDGGAPAAFLKIVREAELKNQTLELEAGYWSQINSTVTNPLATYLANKFEDDHENVSGIQLQNCIFFGSGFNETMKYDGQTFCRAGLPTPASIASALGAAGAITGATYFYKIQYAQYDAAGNIVEGNHLNTSSSLSPTAQKMDVTLANVLAGSGFNTNCAVVAGAQGPVTTITVDNGSGGAHTMKVGDTAYFYDSVSAAYVTRTITAVAATTITVSGAGVTVADNAVISNNLRIYLWRTKTGGSIVSNFYLAAELPNNSFAATQVLSDNLTDAQLGELFIAPLSDRSPPPKSRYLGSFQNLMTAAGIPSQKSVFAYSTEDGCEYFPADSNQILVEPGNGDIITAHAQNNEVYTIHGNSTFTVVSGDLATGQIRMETVSTDAGCSAHATLKEIDGALVWLSPKGPRYSRGGQPPRPLGPSLEAGERTSRIDPAFSNHGLVEELKVRHKRAVGFVDSGRGYYLIYAPSEFGDNALRYATSNSVVWAYDKVRDAWLVWNNINFASGAVELDGEVFFHERRYSTFLTAVQSILYRRHDLMDAWDYADSTNPIELDYAPQWESLGEPSVLKDALNLKVFSLENVANNQFTLTVIQENNFQTDVPTATFDIAFTGGGYGNMAYGDDAYGDPSQDAKTHPLARGRLRSTRTRFTNATIHENVLISGWEIEFSTPNRPEFKP